MSATALQPVDGTSQRWHVRASSITETVRKLSQIWSGVAHDALSEEVTDSERAALRSDPHLMARMDEARKGTAGAGELRIRTRTSVLTLIVVAPAPETAERAMATVSALATRHPSRAIILSPSDPDGPAAFDAHIYAACQVPTGGMAEICTEEILIKTGGELSQHLGTAVAPLLIHDLPVVLWWPDDVPFGSPNFRGLVQECDRLLVDAGQFRGDGTEHLVGMRQAILEGLVVHDIGWMRGMLWRELLAGIYDHPLLTREQSSIRSLRIDVARPGRTTRIGRALTFAGWIASRLEWSIAEPLQPSDDGTYRGAFRAGRRTIPVEIRPVGATVDGSVRSAGSLVRVELESAHPRAATRVRVTRQSDHLLATADWNGAQVARRAARLETFDEMPFLAEALDRTGHDRVFEHALERAVRLLAPAGGGPSGAGSTGNGAAAGSSAASDGPSGVGGEGSASGDTSASGNESASGNASASGDTSPSGESEG